MKKPEKSDPVHLVGFPTSWTSIDNATAEAVNKSLEAAPQRAVDRIPALGDLKSGSKSREAGNKRGEELHTAAEQSREEIRAYYNRRCLDHPENSEKTNRRLTAEYFKVSVMTVKRALGLVK